jgi:LysM repeat protein
VGRLGLVERRLLARYVAPAVFLLAVTGVVLLVRSALRSDGKAATSTARSAPAQQRTAPSPSVGRLRIPAQYYVIQSGDTLDAIASRFATTVDVLLALNPGVEPTTLRPGQRLRIK